jgi:hypothetical protein
MREAGAVVATDGRSPRKLLQSADIVLGEVRTRAEGGTWVDTIFARYPGCLVAAVRHHRGRWCLLAIRGGPPVLIYGGVRVRLFRHAVEALALDRYSRLVSPS